MRKISKKQILIKARSLIADPKNWITGSSYRPPDKFCAMGAISQVAEGNPDPYGELTALEKELEQIMLTAVHKRGIRFAPDWNDKHTHAEVLAAFDRAIQACGD